MSVITSSFFHLEYAEGQASSVHWDNTRPGAVIAVQLGERVSRSYLPDGALFLTGPDITVFLTPEQACALIEQLGALLAPGSPARADTRECIPA